MSALKPYSYSKSISGAFYIKIYKLPIFNSVPAQVFASELWSFNYFASPKSINLNSANSNTEMSPFLSLANYYWSR